MKNLFAKIKTFIDVWKMWLFFAALLAGTNGAQMYVNSEPEKAGPQTEKVEPEKIETVELQKTIIIHKTNNEYCDKKLLEHEKGVLH